MEDRLSFWDDFQRHRKPLLLSWLWFFLVLFSYYCLKPLRDALGTNLSEKMGLLYLATFLATLVALGIYSFLISRCSRQKLLLFVHQFFALCLACFWFGIPDLDRCSDLIIGIFFVWVSVFNLYIVALFWSAMADLFTQSDAKRWFGTMASAGSIGAISGSILANQLARSVDPRRLMLVAIVALELAVVAGWGVISSQSARRSDNKTESDNGTGGSFYAGLLRVFSSPYLLGICGFVVLGKFAATFIYNELQSQVHAAGIDAQARAILFSQISSYSQTGSFILQGFVFGVLIRLAGIAFTIMIPCVVFAAIFGWLYFAPTLPTLASAHAWQQIVSYGILVPAQHLLFTVVPREDKYKSKGFIDTVVFRASDVAAANVNSALSKMGLALPLIALGMLNVSVIWLVLGYFLGSACQSREKNQHSTITTSSRKN